MGDGLNGAMIDLADVHLSLGTGAARVHILRGAGLRVEAGAAIGLVGPSGSGKSSLLSVIAGLGLEREQAFPARLEAALRARGHEVRIVNAGVSGDTASAGLSRLDWTLSGIAGEIGGVVLELGANDALRGIDPRITRDALDGILARLNARGIKVLLAGMRAPPNMGREFGGKFDTIYPQLAEKHGVLLYPFFLDGVAAQAEFNQGDGIHPNTQGVAVIVAGMTPYAEELIALIRAGREMGK